MTKLLNFMKSFIAFILLLSLTACSSGQTSSNDDNFLIGVYSHITRTEVYDDEFKLRSKLFKFVTDAGFELVATEFKWGDVEIKNDKWNWKIIDKVVKNANKHDIKLLATLHAIPKWAMPIEKHLDEWKEFVHKVATRYKDKNIIWEIGGEPDLDKNLPPDLFIKLIKTSYETLKSIDPNNKVIIGGVTSQASALPYLKQLFKLDALNYCDGVSMHPFKYPAKQVIGFMGKITNLMKKYGTPKPIWITGFGVYAWRNNFHPSKSNIISKLIQETVRKNFQAPQNVPVFFVGDTAKYSYIDPLKKQLKSKGWTVKLLDLNRKKDRKKLMSIVSKILIIPAREPYRPKRSQLIYKSIKKGGLLVPLDGMPLVAYSPINKNVKQSVKGVSRSIRYTKAYVNKLGIEYSRINKDSRSVRKIKLKDNETTTMLSAKSSIKLHANSFINRLLQKSNNKRVNYKPLITAYNNKGKAIGEVAALYKYSSSKFDGKVLSIPVRLEIRKTYKEQAVILVKTLISAWAAGARSFVVFELMDKAFDRRMWYYGILEHDLDPKQSYRLLSSLIETISTSKVKYYNKTPDGLLLKVYDYKTENAMYIGWGTTFMKKMEIKKINIEPLGTLKDTNTLNSIIYISE